MRAVFRACLIAFAASTLLAASPIETLRESNARLRRTVLDNGMVCLVKEDRSAPVAAVQVWVGSGAIHEGEFLGGGLTHFIEHMIFKGTSNRPAGAISREISDAGGDINAYTSTDRTVFHVNLPAANWRVAVDVLADAVMNASLPEDEWERERDVILREMAMNRDSPERELSKLLWSTAYRVHPYRVPIIGYEEVFRSLTRDDLAGFFRRNYVPDASTVVVVGDVDAEEVEAYLRETFAPFARRARPPVPLPSEPPQIAPRFDRRTGDYEVARLAWAYHTTALDHPDTPALDVLADVVGSGRSSRLTQELKERRRLVHSIGAWSYTPRHPGLFGISAEFDPANEAAAVEAIQAEVDRWADGDFTEEEIGKARRSVLVGELSSLETMDGQASSYASGEFYAADPLFGERYLEQVEAVDADALRAVARKYLRTENRTLVVLSPTPAPSTGLRAAPETPPHATRLVLSNGMPLIVREDRRLPFVHFCIAFGGGLLAETEDNNGITQLMSDLLTRGTATRSSEEIARAVENLGASLSPFAGRNSFGLRAGGLSQDRETLMDIFADCLLRPAFPEEEIEKQRVVQLAAIRQQYERPFFVAQEALQGLLFPGHPYRWQPAGSTAIVARLARDDLSAHGRRLVNAHNAAVAVFGDISAGEARGLVERHLGGMPAGEPPDLAAPVPAPKLPARVEQREPREQTVLLVGYPGLDVKDPRRDALSVIESSLSGLSSDLFTEVRDKRGLAYYVGAFDVPALQPGMVVLYAGTREDTAGEVQELMAAEVRRIAEDGLREDEFRRAREQLIAAFQMGLQDNAGLAQSCALDELYGLGYEHAFATEQRLRALTPGAVREAAASLFRPEREAVSIVLPAPSNKEKTP